jgi:hypothetical protein
MPAPTSSSSPAQHARGRTTGSSRFMRRRLGALVIVCVVAYSLVRAVGGLVGGDGDAGPNAATSDPIATADPAGGEGASADQTGAPATEATVTDLPVTEPPPTDPPNTDPPNTGPPAPDNKAKVYIVGDSDAGTFGPYLVRLLDGTTVVDTELNYKVSSGLARPDFYNWPVEIAAALPAADPDIVVATFGGNDSQGLSIPGDVLTFIVGDPVSNEAEWTAEYTKRAGEMMDLLLENDRTVIWVGIPNDDNADVTARLAIQDKAAKAAAAARPDVIFIDTWTRFSGRDGGWAEFVIDPRDGVGKDVRADDGFHLNVTGAEILALDIAQAIRDDLRLRGANI